MPLTVTPPAGSLTWAGGAPQPGVAFPAAGTATWAGGVPAVLQGTVVAIPARVVTWTGTAPTVGSGVVVAIPAGRMEFASNTYVTNSGIAAGPVRLFLGGIEMDAARVEWDISCDEVLGGIGTAHLRLQDRLPLTSGYEPSAHEEVLVTIRSSGWRLWHGETLKLHCDIPFNTSPAYRIWDIECQDYNAQLTQRLLGAPGGSLFYRATPDEAWQPIDADAQTGSTDKVTIQRWFTHYFRLPTGVAIDTDTLVGEYGTAGADTHLYQATTTLGAALEEIAGYSDTNIQAWLTPDDQYAWLKIVPWQDLTAGASPGLLPAAPVALGTGGTALLALNLDKDGDAEFDQFYIQGATTYAHDDIAGDLVGGSGWYPDSPSPLKRQAYYSAPAAYTKAQRDAVGAAILARSQDEVLRMEAIVQGVDGFRAGQYVSVTNQYLPPSLQNGSGRGVFVIQRVATSLYAGTDVRQYVLGLGDGPMRQILQYSAGGDQGAAKAAGATPTGPAAKPPIFDLYVEYDQPTVPISHGQTRGIRAYPQDRINAFYQLAGAQITFILEAIDMATEEVVPTSDATLSLTSVTADTDGAGRTTLTADSARDDLKYHVRAYLTLPQ